MKKIITILLAAAMILTFVACDPVTDSKPPVDNNPPTENTPPVDNNGSSTDENQTPEGSKDPFIIVEETLIQRVLDAQAFDLSGIWDFEYKYNDSDDEVESFEYGKGYMTVEDGIVKETCTYYEQIVKSKSPEAFNELKEELDGYLDYYKDWDIKIDDTNLTITLTTTNETALEEMYEETLLELFLDKYLINARTNESRTAFKYGTNDTDYTYSYTFIKQGADVKPTDTPKPDFAAIGATLTDPLASFEDMDFTGTWDFMETEDYTDELGTLLGVYTGYFNVANDKVSMTHTSIKETYILYDDDLYNEIKNACLNEDDYDFKYDDATKTLIRTAGPEGLADYYDEETLSEFVERLNRVCNGAAISTNEAKTAFKFTSEDGYTFIYIKR